MPVSPTTTTLSPANDLNGGARNGHPADSAKPQNGNAEKVTAIADALVLLSSPEPQVEVLSARRFASSAPGWDIIVNKEKFPRLDTDELEMLANYINGGELEQFTSNYKSTATYNRAIEAMRAKLNQAGLPDHNEVQFLVEGLLGGFFSHKVADYSISYTGQELSETSAEILLLRASGYTPEQIEYFKNNESAFSDQKVSEDIQKIAEKIGAKSPVQTVINALALGLVDLRLIKAKQAEIEVNKNKAKQSSPKPDFTAALKVASRLFPDRRVKTTVKKKEPDNSWWLGTLSISRRR